MKLDVYAVKQSESNLSFYPNTSKVENIMLLLLPHLTTHQNWYDSRFGRLDVLYAKINHFYLLLPLDPYFLLPVLQ